MKKNKKKNIYKVVGGFFLSIFLIFPLFATLKAEAATTFYEYINVGGVQSKICGMKYKAMCDIALQQIPGCEKFSCSETSQPDNYICISTIPAVCPKDEVQTVDSQKDTTKSDVYTFLAPLTSEKTAPNNIGDYFNWIFTLAIGLCGALAVIMIVIGGVQYMGEESIFGKTKAREQIKNAIFGLLIALGAFALLNTINPDLLKTSINIKSVSVEIELREALITESSGIPAPGTPLGTQCPGGYGDVIVGGQTLMHTCNTISADVSKMIQDAKKAGINLSGSSYRSYADQLALRTKNCANAQTTPVNQCTPPTAMPGKSMHESGLAVDFKCDGTIIQTRDNKCFLWLQKNAASYGVGLKNLASEPWHWSTTGT